MTKPYDLALAGTTLSQIRTGLLAALLAIAFSTIALAQKDKKTDDDKPADPDTGESTIEEKTLGLLPNPLQKYGVKFAATYIGEALGNPTGGLKRGTVYEGRLNLAVDVDLQKLLASTNLPFTLTFSKFTAVGFSGEVFRTCSWLVVLSPYLQHVCMRRTSRSNGAISKCR
jgi:hypothetical protein